MPNRPPVAAGIRSDYHPHSPSSRAESMPQAPFQRPPLPALLAACFVLGAWGVAAGSEYRETSDFVDAAAAVQRYVDRLGADEVLLVVDIDNTLLAMQGDLGSDQWFEWQEHLLHCEPDSPHLVADDFPGLLEAQGLLFTLGKMRPPQSDLPELVRGVQELGVRTLVLTSRGPQYRPATERELAAAGYDFARTAAELVGVPRCEFLPYDPATPERSGLTPYDVELYRLAEPRLCSYGEGVFMTSGQHTGAMLLTMLHRMPNKPQAVVFVDDHGRHIHRVYDALSRHGVESTVVHYRREDENVNRFRYGDKRNVTARWRRLSTALDDVFALPASTGVESEPSAAAAAAP